MAAANLRLAGLRSVSKFPGAKGFPRVLGNKARRPAVRSCRGSFETDQACRAAQHRRRVPAALIRMALPYERRISRDGNAILTKASRPVPPGLPCVAPVVAEEGTAVLAVGLTWGLTWGVSRLEGGKP